MGELTEHMTHKRIKNDVAEARKKGSLWEKSDTTGGSKAKPRRRLKNWQNNIWL